RWMPMYDFSNTPWTMRDVERQLTELRDPHRELEAADKHRKTMLSDYRKLLKVTTSRREQKLLTIVHTFSYLKEMRDDYRRPAYTALLPFWEEIGRRLHLTIPETQLLTSEEIINGLTGEKIDQALIRKRQQGFALILRQGRLRVVSGNSDAMKVAETI